ncbi:WD40-like Beta Propeller Repeat [Lishizhenia tianjinensis]|uniref:WD40-like Beta Propeller Repeat n=1 Tax=Lishizhenia tianjinensis TaxID=477690 RepID=A0A1I7BWY8_9FLAO|nr:OmpA family protein [Lishizhenia tianjinensis]SFT91694.1 WD40-like Beta Propeller Repeat [Lishizhenia tianjinensis]
MKTHVFNKIAVVILLSSIIVSCTNTHILKGDRYYDALAYAKAIPHYEKAYEKRPDADIALKLADAYKRTGEYAKAEQLYAKAAGNDSKLSVDYACVLMANQKYDRAAELLSAYLTDHKDDNRARMLLQSCESVTDRYIDTTLYDLTPLELDEFTNTFSVMKYLNGIAFIADRKANRGKKQNPWTGDSYLDIYAMQPTENGGWTNPEMLLGDLNGPYHEGPAAFTKNGKEVYFTRSNYFKKKMEINDKRENNLKIFKATLVNNEWMNLVELPFNSDDYSVAHPTLSEDGNTMYFISDMPGGFGGSDIYKTTQVDQVWTAPENLGEDINTEGNEMFPFLDDQGSLFFSSDAHNSMGGLDVFVSHKKGDAWTKPENLNYPINTDKDDFGFMIDHKTRTGFVSSSRSDKDMIYQFTQNDPTFHLIGHAYKKGSGEPVKGVEVEITNRKTNEMIVATSDFEGYFKVKLEPESDYDIICRKIGCFAKTNEVSTVGLRYSTDLYADFEMEEIIINKPIVLNNIYYDFDKWNIRADATRVLDSLVQILNDNPTISIQLGSHTDVRGKRYYNQYLSNRRAKSVVDYLISKGIDENRLTWKGYGESEPINKCVEGVYCSDLEHEENRRTEFRVVKQ